MPPVNGPGFGWRRDFIRTYLERDTPFFNARLLAETLWRLWTMFAPKPAPKWAIEIQRSVTAPAPSEGFHVACADGTPPPDRRLRRHAVLSPGGRH